MSLELPNWAQRYIEAQAEVIKRLRADQLDLLRERDKLISERDRAQGDLARLRGLLREIVANGPKDGKTIAGWPDLSGAIWAARKEVQP